jgi:acetoin utilization protein AcuB
LPVIDGDELVGRITRGDVLGAGVKVGMQGSSELAVEDVMTPDPASVEESESVLSAISRMHDLAVRHLPVVGADHRLVGILSDRDVRSSVGDPFRVELDRIERLRVGDIMTRDPLNAAVGDDVATVAQMFVDLRLSAVPVIDESDRLVGLVSYIDLLRGRRS